MWWKVRESPQNTIVICTDSSRWWFHIMFRFYPLLEKNDPIWGAYFFKWVELTNEFFCCTQRKSFLQMKWWYHSNSWNPDFRNGKKSFIQKRAIKSYASYTLVSKGKSFVTMTDGVWLLKYLIQVDQKNDLIRLLRKSFKGERWV